MSVFKRSPTELHCLTDTCTIQSRDDVTISPTPHITCIALLGAWTLERCSLSNLFQKINYN